jgi:hypothetical protein
MANITAGEVKAIREELKLAFPKWKFSVKKSNGSYSVDVTVLKGNVDFSENFTSPRRTCMVNPYYVVQQWKNPEAVKALNAILEIMYNAPGRAGGTVYFDKSDSQSDYFHTAFYIHLDIGQWDKDYEQF